MTDRRPPARKRPSTASAPKRASRGASGATRGGKAKSAPAKKAPGKKAPAKRRPAGRRPGDGGRRSLLWRWRRGLFLGGLATVAATGGVASIVFNIPLPPEEPLLQTSFVCA